MLCTINTWYGSHTTCRRIAVRSKASNIGCIGITWRKRLYSCELRVFNTEKVIKYKSGKPKIGISTTFEPFIGTLNIALEKRLPDPSSGGPEPDRTHCWVKVSRYRGHGTPLSALSTQVGFYAFLILLILKAQAVPTKKGALSQVRKLIRL